MPGLIETDAFVKEMEYRYNSAISWGKRAVASHDDEMRIRAEQAAFSFVEASMTAKKMPTIDAVEVVRCKDCRHYKHSAVADRNMCFRKDVDGVQVCYDFQPNDFCKYGKRRTEVEE